MAGPDFICIGAQKAGTGWLYEQLREHPDFWMPPLKELHYFDRLGRSRREIESKTEDRITDARRSARDQRDHSFLDAMSTLRAQREIDLPMYAALFEPKGSLISGDITPGYSTLAEPVIAQIIAYFLTLKVIFIARDPVERAWSQLSMLVRNGIIPPFGEADFDIVTKYLQRPEVKLRSHPTEILGRWRRYVSADLLGIFFFDELKAAPAEMRGEVIAFLGGDPAKSSGKLAVDHNPKARKEKIRLTDEMRRHLARFFESELKRCASDLEGPAREWPKRYGF